jgi:hypothetical protein
MTVALVQNRRFVDHGIETILNGFNRIAEQSVNAPLIRAFFCVPIQYMKPASAVEYDDSIAMPMTGKDQYDIERKYYFLSGIVPQDKTEQILKGRKLPRVEMTIALGNISIQGLGLVQHIFQIGLDLKLEQQQVTIVDVLGTEHNYPLITSNSDGVLTLSGGPKEFRISATSGQDRMRAESVKPFVEAIREKTYEAAKCLEERRVIN